MYVLFKHPFKFHILYTFELLKLQLYLKLTEENRLPEKNSRGKNILYSYVIKNG